MVRLRASVRVSDRIELTILITILVFHDAVLEVVVTCGHAVSC